MKKIFASIILISFLAVNGYADTIYLKNGKMEKGEIMEEGSHYVIILQGKVPKRFFKAQIDRIEKDVSIPGVDLSGYNVNQFKNISSTKVTLILQYIELSGIKQSMKNSIDQVIEQAPPREQENLSNIFQINEMIERLVPVFNKYYNEEELKELADFYQSDLGKKVLDVTPRIMQDALQISVDYINEKSKLFQ